MLLTVLAAAVMAAVKVAVKAAVAKAVVAKTLPQEAAAVVEEQEQEHMQFLKPWQR
jgi:hypothetical protein